MPRYNGVVDKSLRQHKELAIAPLLFTRLSVREAARRRNFRSFAELAHLQLYGFGDSMVWETLILSSKQCHVNFYEVNRMAKTNRGRICNLA